MKTPDLVVAYHNLDFSRGWKKGLITTKEIINHHVNGRTPDVVILVEVTFIVKQFCRLNFRVHQPVGQPLEKRPSSEIIMVRRRRGIKTIAKGSKRAAFNNRGQEIGPRRFPWMVLQVPNFKESLGFVGVHFPPLRMQHSSLDEAYDRNLNILLRGMQSLTKSWGVYGDWNELAKSDPAHLRENFDAMWVGKRIDLGALSRGLYKYHLSTIAWPTGRRDNHPILYSAFYSQKG